jgi:hypothetical protein
MRFTTMPKEWRKKLGKWWEYLEANKSSIDKTAYIKAINSWKTSIGQENLLTLWNHGEDTGCFGE